MHHFLSDIRTDNSNQTAANVVRDTLVTAPESLKPNLSTDFNMKKLINDYRKKTRGCPASSATCAQDVVIPLSQRQDSQGGLLLLGDVSAPNGKGIVALSSELCLAVLNQLHSTTFIDGAFKTAPKYFKPIWILRGHVGDHTCVPLVYFLIEDNSSSSYKEALKSP